MLPALPILCLTPVFALLLKPPPLEAARRWQPLNLLQQVRGTLPAARENLNDMRRIFDITIIE